MCVIMIVEGIAWPTQSSLLYTYTDKIQGFFFLYINNIAKSKWDLEVKKKLVYLGKQSKYNETFFTLDNNIIGIINQ